MENYIAISAIVPLGHASDSAPARLLSSSLARPRR